MSNPHDPSDPHRIYEALRSLWDMEQKQSATVNVAVSEVMSWLYKRVQSNSEFLSMFGHLVPQQMTPEPPPVHHQGQPMPGSVPPPDYANGYDDEAQDRAFVDRVNARRNGGGHW